MKNFECIVSVSTVNNERLIRFKEVCFKHKFRVPRLYSEDATFCVSQDKDLNIILDRMINLVWDLKDNKFEVMGYQAVEVIVSVQVPNG